MPIFMERSHSLLPHFRNLPCQFLRRPGRVQRYHVPAELMTEPGLLAFRVLPSSYGNGLSHGVARTLTMEVLHRLPDADPVQTRCVGCMSLRQHRGDFLDQP